MRWFGWVVVFVVAVGCTPPCVENLSNTCAPTLCVAGKPETQTREAGTTCTDGACDGAGACITFTCEDARKGPAESDVDCGGSCAKCVDGKACTAASDCVGNVCVQGRCLSRCGDGVRHPGEACDDGNATNGDGCDDGPLGSCRPTGCGNGTRSGMEGCDDGNGIDGDGCDSNCRVSGCGNEIIAGQEGCDDGNHDSADGCSAACAVEPGFVCMGTPSHCATVCGDARAAGAEQCDDGARVGGDGCSANCTFEPGFGCSGIPSICMTTCGDGVRAGLEACDDAPPAEGGDGCSALCMIETGWACTGTPSICTAVCGDGFISGNEECDDAPPAENGDGCSATCRRENGWSCSGLPSLCMTVCGDGILAGAEACDDAPPAENGDGCSVVCATESGWTCTGSPSTCMTTCGDGITAGIEQCDDNNTQALDGCSATCRNEPMELEPNDDGTPSVGGSGISGNDFDTLGVTVTNATAQGLIDAAAGDTARVAAIGVAGDEDVFALTNTTATAKSVRVDVWNGAPTYGPGRACGIAIDLGITLRNSSGLELADNNDRNGGEDRCPGITFALLAGRTIYVHVVENGDDDVVPRYGVQFKFSEIICGDGVLTPGVEECDDGNAIDLDSCSNSCRVDALDEVEPNETLAEAAASSVQLVTGARLRNSISVPGDIDMFRFALSTETLIRLETFVGTSGDCNATTTSLRLFDHTGALIIEDVTSQGLGGCSLIVVSLPAGTYFVQVSETGNNATVERYFLELMAPLSVGIEAEPTMTSGVNDTFATAAMNLINQTDAYVVGDHLFADDVDVWAITVPALRGVRAEIVEGDRPTETCESNDIDSTVTFLDVTGSPIANDDDRGRGYCSRLDGLRGSSSAAVFSLARNTTMQPQTMYLRIARSPSGLTNPAQFVYRLVVTIR